MPTPTPQGPVSSFTALEAPMVAALKAALADLKPTVHVLVAADLADVEEEKQLTPAVHVLYQGFAPVAGAKRADGTALGLRQQWLCVVATRHVGDPKQGSSARKAAGELAWRVATALMGQRLAGANSVLELSGGMPPAFNKGFMYLPLSFEASMTVSNRA